jgi:hypothetical protein
MMVRSDEKITTESDGKGKEIEGIEKFWNLQSHPVVSHQRFDCVLDLFCVWSNLKNESYRQRRTLARVNRVTSGAT